MAWIARAAYANRPFASVAALHAAMVSVLTNAGPDRQLALLRAHPELARPGPLTAASTAEQGGMGLDRLQDEVDMSALKDRVEGIVTKLN